jgi:hypothetical protein
MRYKTLQKGQVAFASGDTSRTATITAVTTNKSVLFFSVRGATDDGSQNSIRGVLTNTTTLTFTRASSGSTMTVEWTVVEADSGWSVQRGQFTLGSTVLSNTATISSVNTGRTFLVNSHSSNFGNPWGSSAYVASVLTNSTTITASRVAGSGIVIVEWQAVTFDADADGTVQRGQTSITGATATATLSTAVSLSRAFPLVTSTFSAASAPIARALVQVELTDTTTVTFTRTTGSDTVVAEWEVVELGTEHAVQSVLVALAAADGNDDDTISTVVTDDTFSIIPHFRRFGRNDNTSTNVNHGSIASTVTGTTTLNSQRGATTGAATATVFVLSLAEVVVGPTITVQPVADTVILSNETSASFSVTATGTGSLSYDWELEDGVGSGVYANLANGNGATWTGQASASCSATLTAKTLTGRRVRCNVTDDNGTTTTNAVALTIWDGPQVTTFPATNGSGVSTATLTCDYVTGVGEAIEVRIPLSDGDVAVTVTTT